MAKAPWWRDGLRRCGSCEEYKDPSAFNKNASETDGLARRCKRCRKDDKLRHMYGMTLAQYEEIIERQGGGCATCGRTEEENGQALAVDHDHDCCPRTGPNTRTCGKCTRAILCRECNLLIGKANHDAGLLRRLADLLEDKNGQVFRG